MRPTSVPYRLWLRYNILFVLEHLLGRQRFLHLLGDTEARLLEEVANVAGSPSPSDDFRVIEVAEGEARPPHPDPYRPMVFRGAATNWPCCRRWSVDFLLDAFGDRNVTLHDTRGTVDREHPQSHTELSLGAFVDEMREGSRRYLKFSRILNDEPALRADLDLAWLQGFRSFPAMGDMFYLFVGGPGTLTPIHNGFAATTFVQVTGRKRWFFYPPSDRLFLRVRPERRPYFYSDADPHGAASDASGLLRHASPVEVELEAGDVLWFPPLVFHQVENPTESIGAAYKFVHIPTAFRSSPMLSTLFFLQTQPTVVEAFVRTRLQNFDSLFTERAPGYR